MDGVVNFLDRFHLRCYFNFSCFLVLFSLCFVKVAVISNFINVSLYSYMCMGLLCSLVEALDLVGMAATHSNEAMRKIVSSAFKQLSF